MEKKNALEWIADAYAVIGYWSIYHTLDKKTDLGFDVLPSCNDQGIFRREPHEVGEVTEIMYKVQDENCPEMLRCHSFSFKEYLAFGKPEQIVVVNRTSYRLPEKPKD